MKPYYACAGIELYLGDARDVLPTLSHGRDAGATMLLADPPYGVRAHVSGHRVRPLALPTIANDRPEDRPIIEEIIALAWAALIPCHAHAYVFGPFDLSKLRHAAGVADMVWDKVLPTMGDVDRPFGASHERIAFAVKMDGARNAERGGAAARRRRGSVLRHQRPNGSGARLHPTEKPVPLLREIIEMSSRHGDLVLDPCVGSGSTLVAAAIENRRAIGIEIEEAWCEVAAERLRRAQEQLSLLEGGAA